MNDSLFKEDEIEPEIEKMPFLTMTTEEPETEEEMVIRLNNQINHMKFNIQQNSSRCEALSKECFDLLNSTQLLAFDFLFADYLFGDSDQQKVYSFFEQCLHQTFDLSTGNEIDFEKATDHISFLQDVIKECSQSLLNREIKRPNIPKRTSEFLLYLKEQKHKLEKEICQPASEASSTDSNQAPTVVELEQKELDTHELPEAFEQWIRSELGLSHEPIDTESTISSMISEIAFRLTEIAHLKDKIEQMKSKIVDPEHIDSSCCTPHIIEQSPFFIGVKNNCQVLHAAYESMKSQEESIPICFNALECCRAQLLELSMSLQRSNDSMENEIQKMGNSIMKQQRTTDEKITKLRPLIDSIFMRKSLPHVPQDPPQFTAIKEKLETDLHNLNSHDEMTEAEAMMHRKKYREALDMLKEIETNRWQIDELVTEQNNLISQIEEKDSSILNLVMDHCKPEKEDELHRNELSLLTQYEDEISKVFESLQFDEMGKWREEFGRNVASFTNAASKQEMIIKELSKLTKTKTLQEEIKQKSKKIEELSAENAQLCLEIQKAKMSLNEVIMKRLKAENEMRQKLKDDSWLPPFVDRNNPEMVQKYKEMVICPICKANKRDSILSSCGHPVCKACIDKSQGKCPICSVPFIENNIKPFHIQ